MNIAMQISVSLVTAAVVGWISWRYETRRQDRALQRSLEQGPQPFDDEEDWW